MQHAGKFRVGAELQAAGRGSVMVGKRTVIALPMHGAGLQVTQGKGMVGHEAHAATGAVCHNGVARVPRAVGTTQGVQHNHSSLYTCFVGPTQQA